MQTNYLILYLVFSPGANNKYTALPTINHGGQEGFAVLILFRIYIHFESRLQLDRIMVLKNRNLLEPTPD